MRELEVKIIHSSAYQPQSQGLVERSVCTLKELLDKKGQNISQLHLNELIYAVNCQENGEKGSATSRFLGRATRTSLPNSWNRQIERRKQIELRGEEIEKRVQKKLNTVEVLNRLKSQGFYCALLNKRNMIKGTINGDI